MEKANILIFENACQRYSALSVNHHRNRIGWQILEPPSAADDVPAKCLMFTFRMYRRERHEVFRNTGCPRRASNVVSIILSILTTHSCLSTASKRIFVLPWQLLVRGTPGVFPGHLKSGVCVQNLCAACDVLLQHETQSGKLPKQNTFLIIFVFLIALVYTHDSLYSIKEHDCSSNKIVSATDCLHELVVIFLLNICMHCPAGDSPLVFSSEAGISVFFTLTEYVGEHAHRWRSGFLVGLGTNNTELSS